MPPSFLPRLVNDPFGDPGLFIPLRYQNQAVLVDMGDIQPLSARDILKISHIFVSHTHMDHFVGFDYMLRILLGREKHLHIYGPGGFLRNVESKLAAYSWNLVNNYQYAFSITAHEIDEGKISSRLFSCKKAFAPDPDISERPFRSVILEEPGFTVSAEILDHRIPSLAFLVKERFHVNIKKEAVFDLGLSIGPWLNEFKAALYGNPDPEAVFPAVLPDSNQATREFRLKDLAEAIAIVTPGQVIAYVADTVYREKNVNRIINFVQGADRLFIEGAFLEKHADIAAEKHHLTARQAGEIAGRAKVRQFTLFHFSPRYQGLENELVQEAQKAFELEL